MNKKERISHPEDDRDAWVCICENRPWDDGFYPCNDRGEEMEPDGEWDGLYICGGCGRTIDCDTLEVVGRGVSASAEALQSFVLGSMYSTPGASKALEESGELIESFLARYVRGDWGDCVDEDWKSNDNALVHGGRLHAVYRTKKGEKLWVITESDRSATTFLLPDEY
jgi:hypothetical protein